MPDNKGAVEMNGILPSRIWRDLAGEQVGGLSGEGQSGVQRAMDGDQVGVLEKKREGCGVAKVGIVVVGGHEAAGACAFGLELGIAVQMSVLVIAAQTETIQRSHRLPDAGGVRSFVHEISQEDDQVGLGGRNFIEKLRKFAVTGVDVSDENGIHGAISCPR